MEHKIEVHADPDNLLHLTENMKQIHFASNDMEDDINEQETSFPIVDENYEEVFRHVMDTLDRECKRDEQMLLFYRATLKKSPTFLSLVDCLSRTLGVEEQVATSVADKFLTNPRLTCVVNSESELKSLRDAERMYTPDLSIVTFQCLMLSAPLANTKTKNLVYLTEDQDKTRHEDEMEAFRSEARFSRATDEDSDADKDRGRCIQYHVSSARDVEQAIANFFQTGQIASAKRGIHALIMFFGHGSNDGYFVLKNSPHMQLSEIIQLVKTEWLKALPTEAVHLPASVRIIFTQCYGHVFEASGLEADTECRVRVVALTRPERNKEKTVSTFDGNTRKWENENLMKGEIGLSELKNIESTSSRRSQVIASITDRGELGQ